MKITKLDIIVVITIILCMTGVAVTGVISNPINRVPRIAYLYPAYSGVPNVWVSDIDNPSEARQLTFSELGIYDYDFSPDGRFLAFSEHAGDNGELATIRMLDIPNNKVIELVDCVSSKAYCTTPSFSPDGHLLAYQRSESFDKRFGLSRIWLVDLTSTNYETTPLIADTQVVGHSPIWSQDNNTIAFYSADTTQQGILIYDFVPRGDDDIQLRFIPTSHGTMGTISPNGQQIIFPEIAQRQSIFYSHLRIADLHNKEFSAFTNPEEPIDDAVAGWSPNGKTVAFARRYSDDRWTQGYQLYFMDTTPDAEAIPIIFDPRYSTSYFRWNTTGERLVLQRFPLLNEDGTPNSKGMPEIWIYDVETDTLTFITDNAFIPQWASP